MGEREQGRHRSYAASALRVQKSPAIGALFSGLAACQREREKARSRNDDAVCGSKAESGWREARTQERSGTTESAGHDARAERTGLKIRGNGTKCGRRQGTPRSGHSVEAQRGRMLRVQPSEAECTCALAPWRSRRGEVSRAPFSAPRRNPLVRAQPLFHRLSPRFFAMRGAVFACTQHTRRLPSTRPGERRRSRVPARDERREARAPRTPGTARPLPAEVGDQRCRFHDRTYKDDV